MQINRSNYEIWIIDWLDGNLSHHQVEQLKLFLKENPDLADEFDNLTSVILKPSFNSFPNKEHLKKSTTDLSVSQFEYLCVAYLENDLSSGQQNELKAIINDDPEKKSIFELIQKTRLTPAGISYKRKNNLLRRTAAQRVIRLSIIGLSAAAAIVLIIMNYFTEPPIPSAIINTTAKNIMADSNLLKPSAEVLPDKLIAENKPLHTKEINEKPVKGLQDNGSVIANSESTESIPDNQLHRITGNQEAELKKIPVNAVIDFKGGIVRNTLIASDFDLSTPPDFDERSNVSRFFAKVFREKILKDSTSLETPLRGYEIAEAGVTGLNKLFGWEMALDKNNDENGDLRSVYFSSKYLKFNAPVKKSEPVQ